jgi:aminopeptidase N
MTRTEPRPPAPLRDPRRSLVILAATLLATALPTAELAGQEPPPEPAPIQAGMRSPPGAWDTGLDALHYDIALHLSDDRNWIRGHVSIRLRAVRPDVTAAVLDFTGLAVTSTGVDSAPAPAAVEDGRLTIPLGRTLASGEEVVVDVSYRGVPDDALQLRTNVYGNAAAFVDNWPNRTRFWLPSVDHPSDKATARFTVDAPAAWAVVANGRQVGQPYPTPPDTLGPEDGDRRTWVWATEVPLPTYTLVVGAADMVVTPLGTGACGNAPASARADGCVEVTTWLFPRSVEAASPSFARSVEMLDFFTDVIGPYPFEKLAHVQSSTRFGGMENSSAIFYDERALAAGRDIEGTVSHEVAHQWFGDSATPSDWSELWLSEGFATYFGNVFFEYADGEEAFRERMAGAAARYLSSADTLKPVVDTSAVNLFDLLNRNSYQKGGWVLHMLRGIVGDEDFF